MSWVENKPQLFVDEQEAMVDLGVGKNMVRSIRFWAVAAGIIVAAGKKAGHRVTDHPLARCEYPPPMAVVNHAPSSRR